jgi:hypothetical protein
MTEEIDNLLDYLQKAGLNTITLGSPAWSLIQSKHKRIKIVDKTMGLKTKKIIDKTMDNENGQKLSIGKLVRHCTVPQLGLGMIVAESDHHKGYWIVKWCDPRYHDVGELGIYKEYLEIV